MAQTNQSVKSENVVEIDCYEGDETGANIQRNNAVFEESNDTVSSSNDFDPGVKVSEGLTGKQPGKGNILLFHCLRCPAMFLNPADLHDHVSLKGKSWQMENHITNEGLVIQQSSPTIPPNALPGLVQSADGQQFVTNAGTPVGSGGIPAIPVPQAVQSITTIPGKPPLRFIAPAIHSSSFKVGPTIQTPPVVINPAVQHLVPSAPKLTKNLAMPEKAAKRYCGSEEAKKVPKAKKEPKTGAERVREYRARIKAVTNAAASGSESSVKVEESSDSTSVPVGNLPLSEEVTREKHFRKRAKKIVDPPYEPPIAIDIDNTIKPRRIPVRRRTKRLKFKESESDTSTEEKDEDEENEEDAPSPSNSYSRIYERPIHLVGLTNPANTPPPSKIVRSKMFGLQIVRNHQKPEKKLPQFKLRHSEDEKSNGTILSKSDARQKRVMESLQKNRLLRHGLLSNDLEGFYLYKNVHPNVTRLRTKVMSEEENSDFNSIKIAEGLLERVQSIMTTSDRSQTRPPKKVPLPAKPVEPAEEWKPHLINVKTIAKEDMDPLEQNENELVSVMSLNLSTLFEKK